MALSRRWFGVPVLGFYDDFKVTELRASASSAAASLRDAAAWWSLLLDEDKSQTPSTRTKFLGSWEMSSYDGDPTLFALLPTPECVASITHELTDVLRSTPGAWSLAYSPRQAHSPLLGDDRSLGALPDGLPAANDC